MLVKQKTKRRRLNRYSISMSGPTYERLRTSVKSVSLQKFVDGILTSALDDPTILTRMSEKCRPRKSGHGLGAETA
jgi:hypothetical protein